MDSLRFLWRHAVESIVVILLAVMVAVLVLQVFFRFVMDDPLAWSEELARYAFVWVTFLGAAVAFRHGSHIVVDTIVRMFPQGTQTALAWVVDLLVVAALLVLLVQGIGIVAVTADTVSTMLEVPMSWVYAALPVSAGLMLAYQAERALRRVRSTAGAAGPVAADERHSP
jgi:TRAP-type C4-dicarboxylate transport system permease small subunit